MSAQAISPQGGNLDIAAIVSSRLVLAPLRAFVVALLLRVQGPTGAAERVMVIAA
jgi:hypothetical protein